jgi:hypothetical protein
MSKHEEKKCPCCGGAFECKVGDILKCQCFGIQLSVEEEEFIQSNFGDCLCRNCLNHLKQRCAFFAEQEKK